MRKATDNFAMDELENKIEIVTSETVKYSLCTASGATQRCTGFSVIKQNDITLFLKAKKDAQGTFIQAQDFVKMATCNHLPLKLLQ